MARANRAPRAPYRTENRQGSSICSLQFVAALLMVVGFFGPWIAHKTAALTVTGYELSEFAKFFPQIQGGAVPVRRGLFVMPLLAGTVSLALVVNCSRATPVWRFAATGLLTVVATSVVPPFQAISAPPYRLQLAIVAAGVILTVASLLTPRLSERTRGALLATLALAGSAPALWQSVLLHPLASNLYGVTTRPGWGVLTCVAGAAMLLFVGARRAVQH